VLREYAARVPEGKPRRLVLRFFRSPVEIVGDERVEAIELVRNTLDEDARAVPTDEHEALECGLVFRSVGYRGVALPEVPFDERSGTIPNEGGRVAPGVYAAGWIKRGPTGVIGTNKPDGYETAESLLADAPGLPPCPVPDTAELLQLLRSRGVRAVSFDDWRRLDAAEVARGKPAGKPREKLATVAEMLALLDGG